VNLELLKDRGFLADAGMLGLMQFALTGTAIQLPILTQATWGFDPQQAGLATLPLVLPVVLLVQAAGRLYDRFGVRRLAVPAAVIASMSVVLLGVAAIERSLPLLFTGMVVLGMSMPFVNMPANTDGMRRVVPERRGLASGLLQTVRMTGSTVGVAVTAAIAANFELGADALMQLDCGDVSPEVVQRAAAGDPKAFSTVAASVPDDSECLDVIRTGISTGIGWGFVVAGIVASTAFLAAIRWRPGTAEVQSPSSRGR
jgi:MFS family permease